MREHKACRIDGGELIELFDLGEFYLSGFPEQGSKIDEPKVPLTMCMGKTSGLIQLKHTADFSKMYDEYWYRSGMNQTMTEELKGISYHVQRMITLHEGDIVVDIGCNDGTLLRFYPKTVERVGFDPAKNLAKFSEKHSSRTIVDYFNADAFKKHYKKKAKIVTSIAMFYDLEDPNKFVADICEVLDDEGLWVIQMSYLPLMLQQMAFDNICHEHIEYYSLTSLKYLLERHELRIADCQLNDVNGGSFRIYIRKKKAKEETFATAHYREVADYRVASLLNYEKELKLDDPKTYKAYYEKMMGLKKETMDFLKKENANGKTIWGYGASTKGNTLLQWYGLDNSIIDKIAERNDSKWGLMTIGTEIPICSEEEARKAKPDYMVVFPWHFRHEFIQREREYLEQGGKFIFPLPKFEVVGKEFL